MDINNDISTNHGIVSNDSNSHFGVQQSQGLKIWGKDTQGNVYYKCIQCGSSKRKHKVKGLCSKCYHFKLYKIQTKNIQCFSMYQSDPWESFRQLSLTPYI